MVGRGGAWREAAAEAAAEEAAASKSRQAVGSATPGLPAATSRLRLHSRTCIYHRYTRTFKALWHSVLCQHTVAVFASLQTPERWGTTCALPQEVRSSQG